MSALEDVLAQRSWFVPGVRIYGTAGQPPLGYVLTETINAVTHLCYGSFDTGDTSQIIAFSSLTDHRGNSLPEELSAPRVIVRSRSQWSAFVVEDEAPDRFRVARHPDAPFPVTVDLYIVEMGA